MSLKKKVLDHGARVYSALNADEWREFSEELTKTSFILPFLDMLGWNVFNHSEVYPEYTADHGIKRGEKVDYALLCEGAPVVLIEVKPFNEAFHPSHCSQLYRYFSVVTSAKIGILTNGVRYCFYTDRDNVNQMDEKPFLEIDFEQIGRDQRVRERQLDALAKIGRSQMKIDDLVQEAGTLYFEKEVRKLLNQWMSGSPDEELIKLIIRKVCPPNTRANQQTLQQFTWMTIDAMKRIVEEKGGRKSKPRIRAKDSAPKKSSTPSRTPKKQGEKSIGRSRRSAPKKKGKGSLQFYQEGTGGRRYLVKRGSTGYTHRVKFEDVLEIFDCVGESFAPGSVINHASLTKVVGCPSYKTQTVMQWADSNGLFHRHKGRLCCWEEKPSERALKIRLGKLPKKAA